MSDPYRQRRPGDGKRVTMKDVARAAGVSQSTVSFVLNGMVEMRIGDATRQRVLDAAEQLGYVRRAAGRPRNDAQPRAIGMMIDEIATSPLAAVSFEGAQEAAWARTIIVETAMSGGDPAYERAVLGRWAASGISDVIYASILTREVDPPDMLGRFNAVLLNCHDPEERFAGVVPAERRGGETAARALISAGRQRIAFIGGEEWMDASRQRFEGYARALQAAGRGVDPNLVAAGNFLASGGRTAALELMGRQPAPDAIFCANDLTAVGAYEALKELGLRIPDDVAIVGYDDQEIAQHLEPPLTTVLLPHREMAQWCVETLLCEPDRRLSLRMQCPLIERASHGSSIDLAPRRP